MRRLLLEGKATLQELDTYYSIDDVADLNEDLDAWHEAQQAVQEQVTT